MKRLKYAIWILTLAALPFASCTKDEDEKPSEIHQENKNDDVPNKGEYDKVEEKKYLDVATPADKLGEESKELIELFVNDSDEEVDVLSAAMGLTEQQIDQLAKLLVNYYNNSDNTEWMNEFLGSVSTSATESIEIKKNMESILKEVNKVLQLKGVPASELAVFIGEYLSSEGTEADGVRSGASYKPLFDEIYEPKLKEVESIGDAMNVYSSLPKEQQTTLVSALTTYKAHKENKEWVDGFFSGVGVTNPDDVEHLKGLFDQFEEYLPYLGMM